jgi:hypothetical protein
MRARWELLEALGRFGMVLRHLDQSLRQVNFEGAEHLISARHAPCGELRKGTHGDFETPGKTLGWWVDAAWHLRTACSTSGRLARTSSCAARAHPVMKDAALAIRYEIERLIEDPGGFRTPGGQVVAGATQRLGKLSQAEFLRQNRRLNTRLSSADESQVCRASTTRSLRACTNVSTMARVFCNSALPSRAAHGSRAAAWKATSTSFDINAAHSWCPLSKTGSS